MGVYLHDRFFLWVRIVSLVQYQLGRVCSLSLLAHLKEDSGGLGSWHCGVPAVFLPKRFRNKRTDIRLPEAAMLDWVGLWIVRWICIHVWLIRCSYQHKLLEGVFGFVDGVYLPVESAGGRTHTMTVAFHNTIHLYNKCFQ